jgi:hypothetical protein
MMLACRAAAAAAAAARRSELEALKSAEAARQAAAAELTATCAASCLALISSQCGQLSGAQAELCRLLLGLLDGCTMPGDLVVGPGGDAEGLEGLQQRSMLQLERLALAQEEAAPAGAPAAAASLRAQLRAQRQLAECDAAALRYA